MAPVDGRRQIWLRRLGGGLAHQITRDAVDHDHPRWTPDSSAIVYFTPAEKEGEAGTLWEIPALGGTAPASWRRRLPAPMSVMTACGWRRFRKSAGGVSLAILDRDGAQVRTITVVSALEYFTPRWSPDDRSIAFIANEGKFPARHVHRRHAMTARRARSSARRTSKVSPGCLMAPAWCMRPQRAARSGTPGFQSAHRVATTEATIGSSRSATCPTSIRRSFSLARSSRAASGCSRISGGSRFPALPPRTFGTGHSSPGRRHRCRRPRRALTGSRSSYLSNSGGQGNVWVANTDGTGTPRPLTAENDPAVVVGLPLWSPTSDWIVYIKTRAGQSRPVADQIGWQ